MRKLFTLILAALLLSSCAAPSPPEPAAPADPPAAEAPPEPPAPPPPPEPTEEDLAAERIEALLASMTLEERAGQVFFARCPASGAAEDAAACHLGGYLLFSRDFQDTGGGWLTEEAFTEKIQSCQDAAAIPLLIGVDEEGGGVVRASRNPNLFPGGKFHSPQWLLKHQEGDGDVFAQDALEKSEGLLRLGINVNLAPVCDVSTTPGSFIYDRTLGLDAAATADYVSRVVSAMSRCGIGSVLKHFPGYGDNPDTHTGSALDERPLEAFLTGDLLPFRAGTAAGEGRTAVLVSHNVAACMDETLPASLSPAVHELLRRELDFDGVVMTDDLEMQAAVNAAGKGSAAVLALAAGNDLLITGAYQREIPAVIAAVEDGTLSEEALNTACRRVLTWKQALGLIP